jgi:hypothetical protein
MKLRMCLGAEIETDLAPIMEMTDEAAQKYLGDAIYEKPQKGFCGSFTAKRGMGNIGG